MAPLTPCSKASGHRDEGQEGLWADVARGEDSACPMAPGALQVVPQGRSPSAAGAMGWGLHLLHLRMPSRQMLTSRNTKMKSKLLFSSLLQRWENRDEKSALPDKLPALIMHFHQTWYFPSLHALKRSSGNAVFKSYRYDDTIQLCKWKGHFFHCSMDD